MEVYIQKTLGVRGDSMKGDSMKGDIALAFLALILAILGLLTC